MTHFDDCSGIGGFALAAQMVGGVHTRWAREIDPYARSVYAKHFPHVELFADVRDPLPEGLAGAAELYTCGFPCQPVSVAGRRKAQADDRWLWPHIATTLRHLQPRRVLLENVPGILAREPFAEVLASLAVLGYDATWDCLPASAVGAPQRGDRVWIVAAPYGARLEGIFEGRLPEKPTFGTPCLRGALQWPPEPPLRRVDHGATCRLGCLRRQLQSLGNAIVPQLAVWIMQQIIIADASMEPPR